MAVLAVSGRAIPSKAPRTPDYDPDYLDLTIRKSRYRSVHAVATEAPWYDWNLEKVNHSLHTLLPRLGGFPPRLAAWVIEEFSQPGQHVFDPYAGKGTVPLEALIASRVAIANDLAPEAFLATHAKTHGVTHAELMALLDGMSPAPVDVAELAAVPEQVRLFYSDHTLSQILSLQRQLLPESGAHNGTAKRARRIEVASYALACLVAILHGPNRSSAADSSGFYLSLSCSHTHSQSPAYVRRYARQYGLQPPDRDVIACVLKKSALVQRNPPPRGRATVTRMPAADVVVDHPCDLILTSPPYFRAQTYAWDNWLRLWFLGYPDYRAVHRGMTHTTSVPRYARAMRTVLERLVQYLAPGGRIVFVVGDVQFDAGFKLPFLAEDWRMARYVSLQEGKGLMINTSEVIVDVAVELGLQPEWIINDHIDRADRALRSFLTAKHGSDVDRIIVFKRQARVNLSC